MTEQSSVLVFQTAVQADYEKIASESYVTLSDNTKLRILCTQAPNETSTSYSIIIVAGWGSVALGWDPFLMEAKKYFDVIYLETREKGSSFMNMKTRSDLDRLSEDMKEVINFLKIDKDKLILFGSCYGALLLAHGLSMNKYEGVFTILVGPPGRLHVPEVTRYLIPIVPHWIFYPFKPILKWWLKRNTESEEQVAKYTRVFDEADTKKWKAVSKHLATPKYWDMYAQITSKVLLVGAKEDKMHDVESTQKISQLLQNCDYRELKSNKDTHDIPMVELILDYLKEKDNS